MSGLLPLLAKERQVVLLVPEAKLAYFKERFSGENIIVRGVSTSVPAHDLFFRKLILAHTKTRALYIKKRAELFKDHKYLSYFFSILPAFFLGRIRPYIQLLRKIDYKTAKDNAFKGLFDEFHPELVFATDVQNELDIALMREAKERNIRIVGMVRSWDNLTSKGILRLVPEELVVHNNIIKAEAETLSFVNGEHISVIGIPHYDRYVRAIKETKNKVALREKFLRSHGLDPKKKFILFAPFGNRYIRDNKTDLQILEFLSEIDANILVRLPPTDAVNFDGWKSHNAKVAFYKSGNRAWQGGEKLNEISEEDEEELVQSLLSANVVVTGQSTIAVDACAFDVPTVVACFDQEPRTYFDSVKRFYDYEYYEKFKSEGGIRVAESGTELISFTREYLNDRKKDHQARLRSIEAQGYKLDGKATERLASILLRHGS